MKDQIVTTIYVDFLNVSIFIFISVALNQFSPWLKHVQYDILCDI